MIYLSLVWFVLGFLFNFSVNSIKESTFFSDTFLYVFRSSGQTLVNWFALLQRSPSSSCVIWQIK